MEKKPFNGVKRKPEDIEIIEKRWEKKREQIEILSENIRKIKYNVSVSLKEPEKEKEFLTALVIATMMRTAERVGNSESQKDGHFGCTGFMKKHIKIEGNKVMLKYTGKSGVEQDKSFSDEKVADAIRIAIKNSPSQYVFETSDRFRIKADRVNRYLSDFGVRSKDIRGYSANKLMMDKLANADIEEDEKKRKKFFLKTLRSVAEKVGHGSGTLRKHYLIPELETSYLQKSVVIDISDKQKYEFGGETSINKELSGREEMVKKHIKPNEKEGYDEIKEADLCKVLGRTGWSIGYPFQMVGGIKFQKVFLK